MPDFRNAGTHPVLAVHLRITVTCPEVLFLMWLRTTDQCLFFFEAKQTKCIHDDVGDVVMLEQTGHLTPLFQQKPGSDIPVNLSRTAPDCSELPITVKPFHRIFFT